jgi:hypothetical protein
LGWVELALGDGEGWLRVGWWVAVFRRGMCFLVLKIKRGWVVSRVGFVEGWSLVSIRGLLLLLLLRMLLLWW